MNKYFIGIDGGGSKTEVLLSDGNGKVLKHGITGPSNPLVVGKDKAIKNINALLLYAVNKVSCIDFITICVPGFRYMRDELVDVLSNIANDYHIGSDQDNVFYASILEEYGLVVLSGTGSFAIGINSDGKTYSAGGWGYLIGDEGSGYYVGISALKAVIDYYEGRGPYTLLVEEIKKYFCIKSIEELRRVLYKDLGGDNELTRVKKIASLSSVVLECINRGDKIAASIVENTSNELFSLAQIVIKKLEMYDTEYMISIAGGLINFGEYIYKPFREQIEQNYSNFHFVEPLFPPVIGSLMLSYKYSDLFISNTNKNSIVNELKKTYEGVECYVI